MCDGAISADSNSQIKKYIITIIYLWMDGRVCLHLPMATQLPYKLVVDINTG